MPKLRGLWISRYLQELASIATIVTELEQTSSILTFRLLFFYRNFHCRRLDWIKNHLKYCDSALLVLKISETFFLTLLKNSVILRLRFEINSKIHRASNAGLNLMVPSVAYWLASRPCISRVPGFKSRWMIRAFEPLHSEQNVWLKQRYFLLYLWL